MVSIKFFASLSKIVSVCGLSSVVLFLLFTGQVQAHCQNQSIISVDCGKTPSSVFDSAGYLWTVFVQNKHVYTGYSTDLGKTYKSLVKVNPVPEKIYTNGENRPKIALGKNNEIYLSWTQKTKARFTGNIRFSRSLNNGVSFELPRTINDDDLPIGHRFDALSVSQSGHVYLAWLDKRVSFRSKKQRQAYRGISVFYAVSSDQGKTFSKNKKVADHSCQCCRLAIAPYQKQSVVLMWRHIFNKNTRDHAIALLHPQKSTTLTRATVDDWRIDACPHHGPDMYFNQQGKYHLTWFSNGSIHKGIYYGLFDVKQATTHHVFSVDADPGASHPQVIQFNNITYLVWKKFENNATHLKLRVSKDSGKHWSLPISIAISSGVSDHPLLIINETSKPYVSWHTKKQGYQLIPIHVKN